jgi:hypothetical protein
VVNSSEVWLLPVFGRHIFRKAETVIPPRLDVKDISHVSLEKGNRETGFILFLSSFI